MLINPVICIDFETGGLKSSKNPATQVAYQAFELDTYKPILEFQTYIQPYADLEIEEAAMKYTGITYNDLLNGMDSKALVQKMCDDFKSVTKSHTKKPILLGHNINFDKGFLLFLFKHHKVDIEKFLDCNQGIPNSECTLVTAKKKWANDEKMTSYNLSSCCQKAGIEIIDAHDAMNDVKATKELFFYFTNGLRSGSHAATQETTKHTRIRNLFKF